MDLKTSARSSRIGEQERQWIRSSLSVAKKVYATALS
jgi:hypothetical protein